VGDVDPNLGAEHGGPFTLEWLYRNTQDHPIWNSIQTVRAVCGKAVF
jgi:hypothetical protein